MVTTEPTWKPQIHRSARHEGTFSERSAVKATLRALNLVAGTVVAFAALVLAPFVGGIAPS